MMIHGNVRHLEGTIRKIEHENVFHVGCLRTFDFLFKI